MINQNGKQKKNTENRRSRRMKMKDNHVKLCVLFRLIDVVDGKN